jgi:hypothetical protein
MAETPMTFTNLSLEIMLMTIGALKYSSGCIGKCKGDESVANRAQVHTSDVREGMVRAASRMVGIHWNILDSFWRPIPWIT